MDNKVILIVLLTTFFASTLCVRNVRRPKHGKVVVCYLTPAQLTEEPLFELDHMKLSLCTHLVFLNSMIDTSNYTIKFDSLLQIGSSRNQRITRNFLYTIKKRNPHLKITTAVEVAQREFESDGIVSSVPPDQKSRDQFIQSALNLVRAYGFDGLEIFVCNLPQTRDGPNNLFLLIQKLKEEFLLFNYIVTASFLNFDTLTSFTNELVNLDRSLDLLHIPTSNAVILPRRVDYSIVPLKSQNESDHISVEFVIKHLLSHGLKPDKLVLTSSLYAHTYPISVSEMEDMQVEDIITSDSEQLYNYNTICLELTKNEKLWTYHWNEEYSAPYVLVRDKTSITFYENLRSIAMKIKMAIDYGLKGVALYGLQWDDYMGQCYLEVDTYIDFFERYNKIKQDPHLIEALKDLKLPNVDAAGNLDGTSYGLLNNTLYFQPPELLPGPYPVLRTINQIIILALEEKRILDALRSKQTPERRYCIFWPNCAAPIHPPSSATNSSHTL